MPWIWPFAWVRADSPLWLGEPLFGQKDRHEVEHAARQYSDTIWKKSPHQMRADDGVKQWVCRFRPWRRMRFRQLTRANSARV